MGKSGDHILIIDDNVEILSTLEMIFRYNKYAVTIRDRVKDVESELLDINPSLLLMDDNLGWNSGSIICEMVKSNQRLNHIPIIMFSAYHQSREQCLRAGADAFMEKPFEMNELVNTVASLIKGPSA